MSVLTPERVYQGFWVDYSRGNVLGSTITIPSERANVVVAVLSITIAFAGAHLWDIIAYFSYASHATHAARDGVHHQRQMLLRNISTPAGVVLKTIEVYWKWHQRRLHIRLFPKLVHLSLIAMLCSMGFLMAGVLCSRVISTTAIQVLAQTRSCGFVGTPGMSTQNPHDPLDYQNAAAYQSLTYATNCYNGNRSDPACQVFVTQAIPFDTRYTACPFQSSICALEGENQAIEMDTGYMRSDDTFGINSRKADVVSLRKVTTCAPLNVSQYWTRSLLTDAEVKRYGFSTPYEGEKTLTWSIGAPRTNKTNTTWSYSEILSERSSTWFTALVSWTYGGDTPVEFFPSDTIFDGTGWRPIDPFEHTKPDIGSLAAMLIRANGIANFEPVDDPIFSFHVPRVWPYTFPENGTTMNTTVYLQDDAAGVMACADRVQFCVPSGRCTALTHTVLAGNEALSFNLSERANVTLYAFLNSLISHRSTMAGIMDAEDQLIPLLTSNRNSPEYDKLEWEIEVKYWESIALTLLQKTTSDVAAGQGLTNAKYDSIVHWPPGPGEEFFCHAQKMMAPLGFSNLSVFGLSLVVSICGSIILFNVSLATVLRWMPWLVQEQHIAMKQWHEDDILTVQRVAYESNGIGTWRGLPYRVPTTVTDESFERLVDVVQLPSEEATETSHNHEKRKIKPTVSNTDTTSSSDEFTMQQSFTAPFSRQFPDSDEIVVNHCKTSSTDTANTSETFNFDKNEYQATFSRNIC